MKTPNNLLSLLAVVGVSAVTPSVAVSELIALDGGMLVDGYEAAPVHRARIIVKGDRILAAGSREDIDIPEGARLIDVSGRTVLPGLIDAHVHVDLIGHGDYDRYYKFIKGTERLDEVMPIAAKQMLRAGVTSAIDLGTPLAILPFRERIRSGEIPGPRLTVSGPWITRVYLRGVPDEYQIIINSPREGAQAAKRLIDRGVDVIKTWVGLTETDYRAIVQEAHRHGVKVHAHLYKPGAIQAALNAGVDVFQHVGSGRNPRYDDDLVSAIAHRNIPVVQTLSHRIWVYPATVAFPERLDDPVHRQDMPRDIWTEVMDSFKYFHRLPYFEEIGRETRNAKANAAHFVEAGAVIGVGTDAASPLNFHSDAIWFEMRALVDIGMSPLQVISAATLTNAQILSQSDELGTVEPGKLADLIVVDGNPLQGLDVLRNIEFVMKGGEIWYEGPTDDPVLRDLGRRFSTGTSPGQ